MRPQTNPTSTASLISPLWQTTPDAFTNWPYKYSFSDQPLIANNTWCVHKLTLQVQLPWLASYGKQHLMRPQTNPTSTASLISPLWQTTPDAFTNWPYKYSFSDQPLMANNTWCVHKLTLQVQLPWLAPYCKQHLMRPQTDPTTTASLTSPLWQTTPDAFTN